MKVAAGLVLHRRGEVLVVRMGGPLWARKDRAWTIPKGEPEPGEELLACALREWTEETGWAPPPGPFVGLGTVKQSGGKVVHAWAAEGDADPATLVSNTFMLHGREFPEISEARWVTPAEAGAMVVAAQAALFERLP